MSFLLHFTEIVLKNPFAKHKNSKKVICIFYFFYGLGKVNERHCRQGSIIIWNSCLTFSSNKISISLRIVQKIYNTSFVLQSYQAGSSTLIYYTLMYFNYLRHLLNTGVMLALAEGKIEYISTLLKIPRGSSPDKGQK